MARRNRTLEQVVRAATGAFADKGFDQTRVEDIAEALGMLKSSLYHHVSGKSELVYLVFRETVQPRIAWVAEVVASDHTPMERLETAIRGHLDFMLYDAKSRLVQQSALDLMSPEHRSEATKLYATYRRLFRRLVRDAMDSGDLRDDLDPSLTARMLLGTLNQLPGWYRPDGARTPDEIREMMLTFSLYGLSRR